MVKITDEAVKVVKKFLAAVKNTKIHLSKVILFGSYAKGVANEWSDIDIAVVSPDFSGVRFYDNKTLVPYILKVDTRLELHPFRPEDFTEDNYFVREILKHGLEIKI